MQNSVLFLATAAKRSAPPCASITSCATDFWGAEVCDSTPVSVLSREIAEPPDVHSPTAMLLLGSFEHVHVTFRGMWVHSLLLKSIWRSCALRGMAVNCFVGRFNSSKAFVVRRMGSGPFSAVMYDENQRLLHVTDACAKTLIMLFGQKYRLSSHDFSCH
jgi:hypothetical protein